MTLVITLCVLPNVFGQRENLPGLYLDSHLKNCLQKEYQVPGGATEMVFKYEALCDQSVRQSALLVMINGETARKVLPSENETTIRITLNLPKGKHVLAFCTASALSENPNQILISEFGIIDNGQQAQNQQQKSQKNQQQKQKQQNQNPNQRQQQKNQQKNEEQCRPGWGEDMIMNGDIEDTKLSNEYCVYFKSTIKDNLPGWIQSPELEVGKGTLYNKV